MASTTHNAEIPLIEQLASPPKISLQIVGTHTTSEQAEVVDFDLWLDCSKKAKIKSGQFSTSNKSDFRSWDQSSGSSESLATTLYGWLNDWLGDSNIRRRYRLRLQFKCLLAVLTKICQAGRCVNYSVCAMMIPLL